MINPLINSQGSGLQLVGPVGIRPFTIDGVCQVGSSHKHSYDHVTMVWAGKVRVTAKWTDPDGTAKEAVHEYEAPEMFVVGKDVEHEIKALTDHVEYFCIFSHRDFNGLASERYVGNAKAYV